MLYIGVLSSSGLCKCFDNWNKNLLYGRLLF